MAPQEISKFIQNLIKFNDNTKNAYLDCYWKAKLVEDGFKGLLLYKLYRITYTV